MPDQCADRNRFAGIRMYDSCSEKRYAVTCHAQGWWLLPDNIGKASYGEQGDQYRQDRELNLLAILEHRLNLGGPQLASSEAA